MNKCRAIANNFDIWAKQQKHIFKSRYTPTHGEVAGEQRRKTVCPHAHRSPQQLDPPPLTLDIPDHPSLPSIRGKLGSPASKALVLKVGEEERL